MTHLRERLRWVTPTFADRHQSADVLDALVALKPRIGTLADGPCDFYCAVCHTGTYGDVAEHGDDCWLRDLLALIEQVER